MISDGYLSSSTTSQITMISSSSGSLPSTPETIRRSRYSNNITDKRDKSDYNNQLRSLHERPLSFHGCQQDNLLVHKRHVQIKQCAQGGLGNKAYHRRSVGGGITNQAAPEFDFKRFDMKTTEGSLLPKIDLDLIQLHLSRDREQERKRRSEREEIRRRLADSSSTNNSSTIDEQSDNNGGGGKRKNLQSRLQSSMNLQICFMNETASDDSAESSPDSTETNNKPSNQSSTQSVGKETEDFKRRQGRLQAEARQALAQAKDIARMQIAQSRLARSSSPISEMIKNSLEKVGVALPADRRRVSRQLLISTEMNVTQLQVIVNDLHSHIEGLNSNLVSMLLERDDLHMEQDSMLVDIEDLTRYLAAKKSPDNLANNITRK